MAEEKQSTRRSSAKEKRASENKDPVVRAGEGEGNLVSDSPEHESYSRPAPGSKRELTFQGKRK